MATQQEVLWLYNCEVEHKRADGPGKASKLKIPVLFSICKNMWDSIRHRGSLPEAREYRENEERQLGKVC